MKKAFFIIILFVLWGGTENFCFGQRIGIVDTVTMLMNDAISDTINSDVNTGGDGVQYYIDGVPVLGSPLSEERLKKYNYKRLLRSVNSMSANNWLGIGAFGTIKHPGIEINYSIADKVFIKDKIKRSGLKQKLKIRRWELFMRYYYHRNFHHNVMIAGGRSWQRKLKKERFFISQADIGVARTFYDRPTFKVENDKVKRMWFAGDFYLNFNYRFGFGKHFHTKKETYRFYSYFGLMNFFPYNNLYYSRIYVGINLNKFIKK